MRLVFATLLLSAVSVVGLADENSQPKADAVPNTTVMLGTGISLLPEHWRFDEFGVLHRSLWPGPPTYGDSSFGTRNGVIRVDSIVAPTISGGVMTAAQFKAQAVPATSKPGTTRTQRVYRLRFQPVEEVAKQVKSALKECFPPRLRRSANSSGFKVVVMPEPVTNSLIVSAPTCVIEAVAAKICEIERKPSAPRIDLKVTQSRAPSNKQHSDRMLSAAFGLVNSISTYRNANPGQFVDDPALGQFVDHPVHGLVIVSSNITSSMSDATIYGGTGPRPVPAWPSGIQRRTQNVYRLKHQSAADVARQIKTYAKECFPPKMRHLAQSSGFQVIAVPETVTNSLIVSAPTIVATAIAKKIREIDRKPKIHQIDLKISQTGPTGTVVISKPRITTIAGQKARIQTLTPDGKTVEIEVNVIEISNVPPKPARQRNQTAKRRQPPAFSAFSQPKPRTISSIPSPNPTRSTRAPARAPRPIRAPAPLPATSAGRVRLISGWHQPGPTAAAPRRMSTALSVKRYPLGEFAPLGARRLKNAPNNVKIVMEFIRAGVEPRSWRTAGGHCSLILLKSANCLVIRQSFAGHVQIQELLGALRTEFPCREFPASSKRQPPSKGGGPSAR